MKRVNRLIWAIGGSIIFLSLWVLVLFTLNLDTVVPPMWGFEGGTRTSALAWLNHLLLGVVVPITTASLGVLILVQQAHNRIGWLLLLSGWVVMLNKTADEATVYLNFTLPVAPPGATWVALLLNWLWVMIFTLLLVIIGVFPSGRYLSSRWRWLLLGTTGLFFLSATLSSLLETPLPSAYQVSHPWLTHSVAYGGIFSTAVVSMPIALIAALVALFVRFRRAGLVEQQQIKWLLIAIVGMALLVISGLLLYLFSPLPTLGGILVNSAIIFPPLGIGIALLRYRLYDVDVIINRALVYALLTGVLALIYYGSVVLLQTFFVGGEQSPLVIVLSTLGIAALFNPLRQRMQQIVDRRFYRRKYDAQQILAEFARTMRNEVELEDLTDEMVRVVEETMQPAQVELWLRDVASAHSLNTLASSALGKHGK